MGTISLDRAFGFIGQHGVNFFKLVNSRQRRNPRSEAKICVSGNLHIIRQTMQTYWMTAAK